MPGFKPPGNLSLLQWLRRILNDDPGGIEKLYRVPLEGYPSLPSGVAYDVRGLGSVPNALDVGYRGAVLLMSPEEFLGLATPRTPGPITPHVERTMSAGEPVAPPMLSIRAPLWQIGRGEGITPEMTGHEGRNRMEWLRRRGYGDLPVPVHLQPYGESFRARSLTPELIRRLFSPLRSQRGDLWWPDHPGAGVLQDQFIEYSRGGWV